MSLISNDVIYFLLLPSPPPHIKLSAQHAGGSLSLYTMNPWHVAFSNSKETSHKWGYKSQENRLAILVFQFLSEMGNSSPTTNDIFKMVFSNQPRCWIAQITLTQQGHSELSGLKIMPLFPRTQAQQTRNWIETSPHISNHSEVSIWGKVPFEIERHSNVTCENRKMISCLNSSVRSDFKN